MIGVCGNWTLFSVDVIDSAGLLIGATFGGSQQVCYHQKNLFKVNLRILEKKRLINVTARGTRERAQTGFLELYSSRKVGEHLYSAQHLRLERAPRA